MTQIRERRFAALAAMRRFCEHHGITATAMRVARASGAIQFIGTAPDGREFGIGYSVRA